ncbi:polysaccharide pyruvyl transferase family protein [Mycolicibacterium sp. GCM10028919]|uniref:polysaccharide pyruvyl transferase family protein n=1 Tax=Mycolicibacterium sp. GCM10028919 TaxID=3273401 RepID=UPI00361F5DB1
MNPAIFGTFDIGNFGDLMFPIIAERKLSELGTVELNRFSYRFKRSDSWFYDVETIQDFPKFIESTSVVIIGGGHLVHFSRFVAQGYVPTDDRIPHPFGFWWVPAVAARMAGIPVALNAVSVHPHQPRWAEPLMRCFVDSLDYVAVRDVQSKARLQRYASGDTEVQVVPDTVHSISDLVTRGHHSMEYRKLLAAAGIESDYIIVQPATGLRRYTDSIRRLIADARAQGLDVLEVPIFAETVDVEGIYQTSEDVKHLNEWPDPLLLAEVIANARAVIGISLHLAIVASAYGVPVHFPAYSPESKFVALDGLPNIVPLDSSKRLSLKDPGEADISVVEQRKVRVNAHWKRIHELSRSAMSPKCRGWDQILETPAAFKRAAGIRGSLEGVRLDATGSRRLAVHAALNVLVPQLGRRGNRR